MSLTRFVVKGADNTELSLLNTAFPSTITIANLEPVDGSFPTFTTAPIIYVIGADSDRVWIDESLTTTTQFVAKVRSSGGAPGTYTFNIAIETEDTPATSPVGATAVKAPYYCSYQDVKEALANLPISFGTNGAADITTARNHISRAYGAMSGALSAGGYTVPVALPVKTLLSSTITASDNLVALTIGSGESETNEDFPVGSTIRINGTPSGITARDEFVNVVDHTSNKVIRVEWAKNTYTGTITIELCTEGFLFLRQCNTIGAAGSLLTALNIKRDSSDENADNFIEEFESCLKQLRRGDIRLDGLVVGGNFIESLQTENSDQDVICFKAVDGAPQW